MLDLKMLPEDFTFGSYSMFSVVTFIGFLVNCKKIENFYDSSAMFHGTVSAIALMLASICSSSAIKTDKHVGPIVTVINGQVIVVSIVHSLLMRSAVHALQWFGFIFGILGIVLLTLPEVLKQLRVTLLRI